jgi:hypothetical protein
VCQVGFGTDDAAAGLDQGNRLPRRLGNLGQARLVGVNSHVNLVQLRQ